MLYCCWLLLHQRILEEAAGEYGYDPWIRGGIKQCQCLDVRIPREIDVVVVREGCQLVGLPTFAGLLLSCALRINAQISFSAIYDWSLLAYEL